MGGGLWLGGHSAIGMLQVLHIWVFQAQFSKVPLKRVSNFFKIGNQKNFALTPLIIIFYCIFKLQFSPNTKIFFLILDVEKTYQFSIIGV